MRPHRRSGTTQFGIPWRPEKVVNLRRQVVTCIISGKRATKALLVDEHVPVRTHRRPMDTEGRGTGIAFALDGSARFLGDLEPQPWKCTQFARDPPCGAGDGFEAKVCSMGSRENRLCGPIRQRQDQGCW